ncbi:hypothetical protein [Mycobacterium sp. SMC-19]|uniref:hypothetical protein n=1 Tax=Mycobacterium sp. SMC-19 TaxID=3381630 RepID=UPI0038765D78
MSDEGVCAATELVGATRELTAAPTVSALRATMRFALCSAKTRSSPQKVIRMPNDKALATIAGERAIERALVKFARAMDELPTNVPSSAWSRLFCGMLSAQAEGKEAISLSLGGHALRR